MTENWLQQYLREVISKGLCTKVTCTTCGATRFREGVLEKVAIASNLPPAGWMTRKAAVELCRALASVTPIEERSWAFEAAVRCILYDIHRVIPEAAMEQYLQSTWAGDLLHRMQQHHRALQEKRKAEGPEGVKQRREEEKRVRHEAHLKRLELKKERDRAWFEKQAQRKVGLSENE